MVGSGGRPSSLIQPGLVEPQLGGGALLVGLAMTALLDLGRESMVQLYVNGSELASALPTADRVMTELNSLKLAEPNA